MDLLELQGWMRGRLGASSAIRALTNNRVYDQPPEKPQFPYITLGYVEGLPYAPWIPGCHEPWEAFPQVDCWSRAVGYPECKQIVDAVIGALAERHPVGFIDKFILWELRTVRVLRDPDGVTSHGVVMFRTIYGTY